MRMSIKILCMVSALTFTAGCEFGEKSYVYEKCVERVKSRLKAPATAVFSSLSESRINQEIQEYPNDGVLRATWFVNGHVDAQNSFGANIRSNFSCEFTQWKDEIKLKKFEV